MTREEAIKRIKARFDKLALDDKDIEAIQTLIPELAESEDERIRKALIQYLKDYPCNLPNGLYSRYDFFTYLEKEKEDYSDFLEEDKKYMEKYIPLDKTTLVKLLAERDRNIDGSLESFEKQKEQKTLSTEETKLNSIPSLEQLGYTCVPPGAKQKPILKFKIGDKIHLIDGTSPNYEDDCITIREIGTVNYIGEFKEGYVPIKEQNKWELVKEQNPAECLKAERDGWYMCIKDYYCGGKKQCTVGNLVQAKGGMYMMGEENISEWFRRAYYEEVRDAFEPNADTNIPEQPAEWSEEDERLCTLIAKCIALGRKQGLVNDDDNIACLDLLMRKDASWSSGDEKMLKLIISELEQEGKDVNAPELYKIEINWLKSLRPSWKPTEEQMEALKRASTNEYLSAKQFDILVSLYEQLKKLM